MNHQKAEFEVLADIAKSWRQRRAILNLKAHGGDAGSIGVLMRYNRRDIRESLETLRQLRQLPRHRRRFVQKLQFPAVPIGNSQNRATVPVSDFGHLDCGCMGFCNGHHREQRAGVVIGARRELRDFA